MQTRIDHFMYAFPSLEAGSAWAEETFGVAPAYGGEHVGLGTRNALLSLDSTYLEIIVPDPAQPQEGNFGERLGALSDGGLVTWAAEGDLAAIAASLAEHGVDSAGPTRTQRQTAEGDLLVWELLFPLGSAHGGRMPFFIDWLECTNPRLTTPAGGQFKALSMSTPDADNLSDTLTAIGLDIPVQEGEAGLQVSIETANGEVVLSSTAETRNLSMR